MVLEPPAIPTYALELLFFSSTKVQVPVSTSSASVPELLAPSTEVCISVPEHLAPSTEVDFISERIAPPAGVSERMALPTGVSKLCTLPTPSLPSSADNLAMLANREAMVYLVLARAHSRIYVETLPDGQMPQLVEPSFPSSWQAR
jgi:hypothetical protein